MKKLFSTSVSDTAFNIATLLLRCGFGTILLLNFGLYKLTHYAAIRKQFGDPYGILGPSAALALVIFAEFFCAVFVILGLFTRLACIPIIIVMATAFFKVHKMTYGAAPGTGQMALLFLIAFFTILFTGPGRISLDRFIGK